MGLSSAVRLMVVLASVGAWRTAAAQTPQSFLDPDQTWALAQTRAAAGDAYRAITEFRRFAHLAPQDPRAVQGLETAGWLALQARKYSEARALSISDESEHRIGALLARNEVDDAPFESGEVSFHSGWTFHRADPNRTNRTRAAFTIIYMDRDILATEPQNPQQAFDLRIWLPGVVPGEAAASPINPILYEAAP